MLGDLMLENATTQTAEPLKVLHLYSGNMYGGIETILTTLARHQDEVSSMIPEFALCFGGRLREQLADAGCSVHDLGAVRVSRPWTVWNARRRLRILLATEQYDVVVTHACWIHALLASTALKHCPVVFWGHDINYGKHWIERWAARQIPTAVVANSEATLQSIRKYLKWQCPAEVVCCPVEKPATSEPEDRRQLRQEMGANPETTVIVQVGRLDRYKGLHLHLEALAKLPRNDSWQSWIVGGAQRDGDHDYLSELQDYAKEHGLNDYVKFLGQRSDVYRVLNAADLFCHPNIRPEPFGIVFIEALYSGLPVVATSIGGAAEIVTTKCGILVEPNDSDQLASALQNLVESQELQKAMGQCGPDRAVELCDIPTQMARLETSLRAAIKVDRKALANA